MNPPDLPLADRYEGIDPYLRLIDRISHIKFYAIKRIRKKPLWRIACRVAIRIR